MYFSFAAPKRSGGDYIGPATTVLNLYSGEIGRESSNNRETWSQTDKIEKSDILKFEVNLAAYGKE